MDVKKHITALGFIPKNGTSGIYHKVYSGHDNYVIFHLAYNEKFISYMDKNNNFFYWNNNNPLYYRYADAIFNDYYFSKFY